MSELRSYLVALLALCAAPVLAQERIALDAATIGRLGLVFTAVEVPDNTDGARFPARVIASPLEASELHAVHAGVLETWHVEPGDAVEPGAVLASLRSGSALALQQQYVATDAAASQAAFELGRDRSLFEQGVIAEQRLRETERVARESAFALRAAEAALAQTGFDAAELDMLREEGMALGLYRIKAPFAGWVARRDRVAGDMIAEGDVVATIRSAQLWVSAQLPATLATRVAVGQTLRLADGGAELTLQAKDAAIDTETQTVSIHARFNGDVEVLPGQTVTLLLPPLAGGVIVPADAVVRSGMETLVYVRTETGIEVRSPTLQALGASYLATDGLRAGEQVVVRGASLLKGISLGLGGE